MCGWVSLLYKTQIIRHIVLKRIESDRRPFMYAVYWGVAQNGMWSACSIYNRDSKSLELNTLFSLSIHYIGTFIFGTLHYYVSVSSWISGNPACLERSCINFATFIFYSCCMYIYMYVYVDQVWPISSILILSQNGLMPWPEKDAVPYSGHPLSRISDLNIATAVFVKEVDL